jgi:hypothetical protein
MLDPEAVEPLPHDTARFAQAESLIAVSRKIRGKKLFISHVYTASPKFCEANPESRIIETPSSPDKPVQASNPSSKSNELLISARITNRTKKNT